MVNVLLLVVLDRCALHKSHLQGVGELGADLKISSGGKTVLEVPAAEAGKKGETR